MVDTALCADQRRHLISATCCGPRWSLVGVRNAEAKLRPLHMCTSPAPVGHVLTRRRLRVASSFAIFTTMCDLPHPPGACTMVSACSLSLMARESTLCMMAYCAIERQQGATNGECNICCYNVTITTLIILVTGPKREYPDRGVNWKSTINKGHILNGLVHSFTIRAHIYQLATRMGYRTND